MSEESKEIELLLLTVTRQFLQELKAEQALRVLSLNSALERDLGLGSLERVELSRRIESHFSIRLELDSLEKVKILSDFVSLIIPSHLHLQFKARTFTEALTESQLDPGVAKSFIHLVNLYSEKEPERPHIYLQNDEGEEEIITYGELAQKAKQAAALFIHHSIKQGETIAVMLPTCREYFYIFLGILFAGAIPVPIYPPTPTDSIEDYIKRQAKVLQNAEIRMLFTVSRARPLAQILKTFIPSLNHVFTLEDLKNSYPIPELYDAGAEDGALIQYTSGSTGDPKGVYLTHTNLLENIRACGKALQVRPNDVMISWLPLYHDMGLIGTWLGSLYFGIPACIFSPLLFLMRPERWLWAIHYHRGTISGAPNFAYELCVNTLTDEKLSGLDLSSWRLALNGSEMIHASTLNKFSKKFAAYQFNPKAMAPAYGLAESTMALIFNPLGRGPKIDKIKSDIFMQQGRAQPGGAQEKNLLEIVSCGESLPGHSVRIVNDRGELLNEREVGSLQFQGPSSMKGYFNNPGATQKIVQDNWTDSGDWAYFAGNEIYITGRKKDIIILAGRNIHPEEIERIAGDIPGLISGGAIAFGVSDSKTGTEQCIVAAETAEQDNTLREYIKKDLSSQVALQLNILISQVILLEPKTVPKTASGKLQRSACKQSFLNGGLQRAKKPAWLQKIKLIGLSLLGKCQKLWVYLTLGIYSIYAYSIFLLTGLVFVPIILLMKEQEARKILKIWAKTCLALMFVPIEIEGNWSQLPNQTAILVSNHASYLDSLVLVAVLPADFLFLLKDDLLKIPVLNLLIKKTRNISVNRLDFQESIEDVKKIENALKQGKKIFIFPEGTFTYSTGLRPFKMGAFKLAVDLQVPVCPIAIKGTRKMLRDTKILLNRQRLSVYIHEPLFPEQKDWEEAVRLRNLTRQIIAEHCGEQTLDRI